MAWTDYRELEVWKKAHQVTLQVYAITREWPKEELYGLTSQARRAAVSVEANLAEGKSRTGRTEFGHFVSMAAGSAAELDCELQIARDKRLYRRRSTRGRLLPAKGSPADVVCSPFLPNAYRLTPIACLKKR